MSRNNILNVIAATGGIGGALVMAAGTAAMFRYAFLFFLCSSICSGFLHAKHREQRGLFMLDIFYTCINIYGVVRWTILV